jgi:hypothetical protein
MITIISDIIEFRFVRIKFVIKIIIRALSSGFVGTTMITQRQLANF